VNREKSKTTTISKASILLQKIEDYKLLIKFRLTLTVVFSSIMAYILATPGKLDWVGVGTIALGGFLVTGAANALNEILEKDYDREMTRTANRPLPAGRMKMPEAILIAGIMSITGVMLLAMFNFWAAFFGMVSMLSYAFIYTPLKRISPFATLVGAVPGAMPMLIGAVAIEGQLSAFALLLFAFQFFWQFPHFWAIGWLGFDDYKKAGFKLVPTVKGKKDPRIGIHSAIYALFLLPVVGGLFFIGKLSLFALIVMAILTVWYAIFGMRLYKKRTQNAALRLMFSSFIYLPLSLIIMWIDKII